MPEIEVFEVPAFAEDWVRQVWDGKMRPEDYEQYVDAIKWAREMGILYNQSENMQAIVNLGLTGKKNVKITNSAKSLRKNVSWSEPAQVGVTA